MIPKSGYRFSERIMRKQRGNLRLGEEAPSGERAGGLALGRGELVAQGTRPEVAPLELVGGAGAGARASRRAPSGRGAGTLALTQERRRLCRRARREEQRDGVEYAQEDRLVHEIDHETAAPGPDERAAEARVCPPPRKLSDRRQQRLRRGDAGE